MPNIVRISHFDVNVGRILGEGGFGKVYRAKDVSEETPVECAAKQMQLNNDTRPAMEREVQFTCAAGAALEGRQGVQRGAGVHEEQGGIQSP